MKGKEGSGGKQKCWEEEGQVERGGGKEGQGNSNMAPGHPING